MAITTVTNVVIEYMIPGPRTERTAFRSFVARDMMSPVGCEWKKERDILCRCAKKSLRSSYSMRRLTPMRIFRIQNRKNPSTTAMPTIIAA